MGWLPFSENPTRLIPAHGSCGVTLPVTDQEVLGVCQKLPGNSFLLHYIIHCASQTNAPFVYHIGGGLATLATSIPKDLHIRFGGALYPNLYTLFVGRSGDERKSTSVGFSRELVQLAYPDRIGFGLGSEEGLVESLSEQGTQAIYIDEFGNFLSKSGNQGYFESVKSRLTDLWDARPTSRRLANKKLIEVRDPRLSIIAGCATKFLEEYTTTVDWEAGFMGRWLIFYGVASKAKAFPMYSNAAVQNLYQTLQSRASIASAATWSGWDPAALQTYTTWHDELQTRNMGGSKVAGVRSRAPAIALRIAMLLSWDFGGASNSGGQWYFTSAEIDPAIMITELYLKSVIEVSAAIADSKEGQFKRKVVNTFRDLGGSATIPMLTKSLQMIKKRDLIQCLEVLVEEGVLETPALNQYNLVT